MIESRKVSFGNHLERYWGVHLPHHPRKPHKSVLITSPQTQLRRKSGSKEEIANIAFYIAAKGEEIHVNDNTCGWWKREAGAHLNFGTLRIQDHCRGRSVGRGGWARGETPDSPRRTGTTAPAVLVLARRSRARPGHDQLDPALGLLQYVDNFLMSNGHLSRVQRSTINAQYLVSFFQPPVLSPYSSWLDFLSPKTEKELVLKSIHKAQAAHTQIQIPSTFAFLCRFQQIKIKTNQKSRGRNWLKLKVFITKCWYMKSR